MSKKGSKTMFTYCFDTPMGRVLSAADESYLYVLVFEGCAVLEKRFSQICDQLRIASVQICKSKILEQLEDELNAYFDGTLQKFTVPIKLFGTQFHQAVWSKLQDVPYGSTYTYGDFAKLLGCPVSHARAIGNACANNSHLILIPCHRVVAVDSRGGYNSGAERKQWLINHEKKHAG